jgi:adenylate kinase
MSRLAVILFGPPAAGKGTQARMVAASLGFPSISTGDILREAVRNRTELGTRARGYMDAGALVPDSLVDAIVRERVGREDCARGFILDGYPRTIKQAEFLEGSFGPEELKTLVIGIMVADDVLVARISGRRSCPACNKVFGASSLPAGGELNCDECGTPLVQRKDDTAEVMKERLDVYHRQTRPLINHYRALGRYFEVEGDRPSEAVLEAILQQINDNR